MGNISVTLILWLFFFNFRLMIHHTFLFYRVTVCKDLNNFKLKLVFVLLILLDGIIPLSFVSGLYSV